MGQIAENIRVVKERIADASGRSGRSPGDVRLVAVTKTVEASRVLEALEAGITDIGENYIQEAAEKWSQIGPHARWHFIGHLQRNKAKNAAEIFDMVQTVDSLTLAQALARRAVAADKMLDVLIEVNTGEESGKFGVGLHNALDLVDQVSHIDGLRVMGLMGMTPIPSMPEQSRPYFADLKAVWDRLPPQQRIFLSMGMTMDFEVAIEEGANMVRVGAAIFGARRK